VVVVVVAVGAGGGWWWWRVVAAVAVSLVWRLVIIPMPQQVRDARSSWHRGAEATHAPLDAARCTPLATVYHELRAPAACLVRAHKHHAEYEPTRTAM